VKVQLQRARHLLPAPGRARAEREHHRDQRGGPLPGAHARILYFHHGGDPLVFISSADWMPRNLDRRVELLVPVDDEASRARLIGSQAEFYDQACTLVKRAQTDNPVVFEPQRPVNRT
jgi:hypothetical protein